MNFFVFLHFFPSPPPFFSLPISHLSFPKQNQKNSKNLSPRCPRCEDVFVPRSRAHAALDGAYFGTTCPHLLLLTYPGARPPPPDPNARYVPRVFGFRLHHSATARIPPSASSTNPTTAVSTVAGGPTVSNNQNTINAGGAAGGGRRSAAAAPGTTSAAPSSSTGVVAAAASGSQEMKDAR